jgi:glycosidase
MKRFLPILLIILVGRVCSRAQDNEQRIPDGVKKSTYYKRTTEPKFVDVPRVDPPNWFVDMNNQNLELLIHDNNISNFKPTINYKGIRILQTQLVANPNYLFVEIEISKQANPGKFNIELTNGKFKKTMPYELKVKHKAKHFLQKWGPQDVVYLAMPDRFANGDTSNDVITNYKQNQIDRKKMFFRHGGDLKGIHDHIQYLKDLGITALWLNPVIENDQPYESYHGYAFTNYYAIDKRFGSLDDYKILIKDLNSKGIKMVQDMVFNHVGDNNWFLNDLPEIDWIHQTTDTFRRSNYRDPVLLDPYASQYDKTKNNDGWFDYHMPDLNQKNPRLARYLIQNSIWWIAETGIDAYRIDTYAYPDQQFMATWGKAVLDEFPEFPIFAETWVSQPAFQAHFSQGSKISKGFETYLPAVTDFQLYFAIKEAFTKEQNWTDGVSRLYFTLAQDGLYQDANRNITFLDNHDMSRFYSEVNEDVNRLKGALTLMFCLRGIPSLYYGTELLFSGKAEPDGKVRQDFPGGWKEDPINKFKDSGRTTSENEMLEWTKKLIKYRKDNEVLQTGKITQFIPENGIYVLFRKNSEKTIMVICNTHNKEQTQSLDKCSEFIYSGMKFKNVLDGNSGELTRTVVLKPYQTMLLELIKE